MRRKAFDIEINILKIRKAHGLKVRSYPGTSRDALLIIEGNLKRLVADWGKMFKPKNVNAQSIASMYHLSDEDARAFAEFAAKQ